MATDPVRGAQAGDGPVTMLALRVYVFACDAEGCDADTGKIDPPTISNPARSA